MTRWKPLEGKLFGRLTCICPVGKTNNSQYLYLCICECGNEKIVSNSKLVSGATKSCGCLRKEVAKARLTTHGLGKPKYYYKLWLHIKDRCLNPNNKNFKDYGGRGITICDEWRNNFKTFYDYILGKLGPRPSEKHSLDRQDNAKGYSPENVRWATTGWQTFNRRFELPKSGTRGIIIENNKYKVKISNQGKQLTIGIFDTKEAAIEAYKKAALEIYGTTVTEHL